jgi:hypothetical protein
MFLMTASPALGEPQDDSDAPKPFSRIGLDVLGDTVATASIRSRHPVLVAAGVTYKLADLANDVGVASIGREDHWLGAELVLVDEDGRLLKAMKNAGMDLNGTDAEAVKHRLHERMLRTTAAQNSPLGYTARVIIKNLPYALAKVGREKIDEEAVGFVLNRFGVAKLLEHIVPVPKKINWALNYGGPLEELQKGLGWGKLGTRARLAQKIAEEALIDQEKKLVAHELEEFGASLVDSTADALSAIYSKILQEHPSQPRTVIASNLRLEMAREAVLLRAWAEPTPAMVPAALVMRTMQADPVVRAIQADDATRWEYARNSSYADQRRSEPAPVRPPEPAVDPHDEVRRQALHEELLRVGDGKTFVLCSSGCPQSDSSWDGRRGETLIPKH